MASPLYRKANALSTLSAGVAPGFSKAWMRASPAIGHCDRLPGTW
jgi:hypothetical protein